MAISPSSGRSRARSRKRPARRKGRPPAGVPTLARARVLTEALALLDRDGLAGVSLRALARRLDVTPMALYNHFASKGDLLDALHEAVLLDAADLDVDGGRTWQEHTMEMAVALRRALRAHPNALLLFATRPVRALPILKAVDDLLARLLQAGFSERQGLFLLDCTIMFTTGHAFAEFGESSVAAPERDGRELAAERAALSRAGLHSLMRVVGKATPHNYDAEFAAGLRALVAGFGQQLANR